MPAKPFSSLLRCFLAAGSAGVLFDAASVFAADQPNPARVARQVDRLLNEEVYHDSPDLAPECDDATFVRLAWLDIVGDIPTPEHVTAFLLDPRSDKRDRLISELVAKPQYGQNWARYWRDVVLSRRIEDRAVLVGNPLVVKLTQQLNDNTGWDTIAGEFITATGDVQEDGSTAIFMAQDGQTEEATAEVSRIFLGIQIQCAQCHDHPWDRWEREDFHELAAFFPRVGVRPLQTPTRRSYTVVVNDRPELRRPRNSNNANRRGSPEHYMPDLENPEAPGKRTKPKFFLTGAELSFGTPDADRRGQLAEWLTDSPWFATAMVNRMWSELVGEGFYEPIDDLGPDREATASKAVEHLSQQFARSGYDVKWLVRTICATDAYRRESRPRRGVTDTPMLANVPQRLRGDQLFNALLTALGIDETKTRGLADRVAGGRYGGQVTPRLIFNTAFGYDPSVQRETVSASIPQALAMMNTPRINYAASAGRRTMLGGLLAEIKADDQLVDELYLRSLSREPTDSERAHALTYVESIDRRSEAFEDLLWALLNSAEFVHRK
ncbi:MAG: DUF1549 domain-containing protein [Planctomycetota bacterium]